MLLLQRIQEKKHINRKNARIKHTTRSLEEMHLSEWNCFAQEVNWARWTTNSGSAVAGLDHLMCPQILAGNKTSKIQPRNIFGRFQMEAWRIAQLYVNISFKSGHKNETTSISPNQRQLPRFLQLKDKPHERDFDKILKILTPRFHRLLLLLDSAITFM